MADPKDGGPQASSRREGIEQAAHDAGVDVETAEAVADSLYEPVDAGADGDNPFGRPGRPMSRSSAFYRGFVGAVGVLVALALGYALREVESVLILVLIAIFLAVGLNPIVEFMIRRGLRRRWAVLIVAMLALGIVVLIVVVLVGALRNQVETFIDDAPHLIQDIRKHKSINRLDQKYHFLSSLETKLKDPQLLRNAFGGVFNIGLTVLGAVVNTVVVFVLTLYFLAALPKIKHAGYSLVPASRRARVASLGDEILRRVGGYVVGAVLVGMLAGTVSFFLLLSVGLGQYALPLALLVAVLDLVPLVGSILGAGTVTIIGLATSLHVGLACLIFYLIYEPLEGYVIYPRVMRSSVDVPEFVTIIAVLVGGSLAGVVGALLALPIAAAVLLLVREVWVRKQEVC